MDRLVRTIENGRWLAMEPPPFIISVDGDLNQGVASAELGLEAVSAVVDGVEAAVVLDSDRGEHVPTVVVAQVLPHLLVAELTQLLGVHADLIHGDVQSSGHEGNLSIGLPHVTTSFG